MKCLKRTGWIAWGFFSVAMCASAAADVFTVDDDGGANFLEIEAALQVAQDGDLILVEPGTYSSFVISSLRITIVGQAGVEVLGRSFVRDQSKRVELASMELDGLTVENCLATVVLDKVSMFGGFEDQNESLLRVFSSEDVRVRSSTIGSPFASDGSTAVLVRDSRFEISDSKLEGAEGASGGNPNPDGGDGGNGMLLQVGARVVMAGTEAIGGYGGLGACLPFGNGGRGGDALRLEPGAEAVVVGRAHTLQQGGPGEDCPGGPTLPGDSYFNEGALRISGMQVQGFNPNLGTLVQPNPVDPWLQIIGEPTSGSLDSVARIWARPGQSVVLELGRVPTSTDTAQLDIETSVFALRKYDLGVVPSEGFVEFPLAIAGLLPQGSLLIAHAKVNLPNGDLRLTNTAPMVIR